MYKEEFVQLFIDNIKKQYTLMDYQEKLLKDILESRYDKMMSEILGPVTSTDKFVLLGRSPVQCIMDEMHFKHTL